MKIHINEKQLRWIIKPIIFIVCLIPLIILIFGAATNDLGANPVETITHITGEWSLRFLWITLAITPLRQLTGNLWLTQLRRMLGLYSFFYVCLHLLTYLWFDQYFELPLIWEDILERPYITVGFAAFILLIPLAVTSTNKMMRRLGRNWKKLHQLVYIIAILAATHFLWLVKADYLEPTIYIIILVILLFYRFKNKKRA